MSAFVSHFDGHVVRTGTADELNRDAPHSYIGGINAAKQCGWPGRPLENEECRWRVARFVSVWRAGILPRFAWTLA